MSLDDGVFRCRSFSVLLDTVGPGNFPGAEGDRPPVQPYFSFNTRGPASIPLPDKMLHQDHGRDMLRHRGAHLMSLIFEHMKSMRIVRLSAMRGLKRRKKQSGRLAPLLVEST